MHTFVNSAIMAAILATASQAKVTYTYYKDHKNYKDAQAACKEKGGNLATIRNKEELAQIQKADKVHGNGMGYIGAIKINSEWQWSTGTRTVLTKNKIYPQEFYYSNKTNTNCALYQKYKESLHGYPCSHTYPYFCENGRDGDNCEAKAASFATSMEDPEEWETFKKRAACKAKASTERSATREAAVQAYLAQAKLAKGAKAGVTEKAGKLEESKASKKLAQKALEAAKTLVGEAETKERSAQSTVTQHTTAERKAQKDLNKAKTLDKKTDGKLANLKKAAVDAHKAFGKGIHAMADEFV